MMSTGSHREVQNQNDTVLIVLVTFPADLDNLHVNSSRGTIALDHHGMVMVL